MKASTPTPGVESGLSSASSFKADSSQVASNGGEGTKGADTAPRQPKPQRAKKG